MELGATMELGDGRESTRGRRRPFYSHVRDLTIIHMFSLRHAVLPLQERGTTARPRGTTMGDHGTSAAAREAGTCLTESSTSASAVLPLPLALLPQGRKVQAYEEHG